MLRAAAPAAPLTDERIRLEGRVERLEAAAARYPTLLAALRLDAWWEPLAQLDAVTQSALADEANVLAAESHVARNGHFDELVSQVRAQREALGARALALEPGAGSWSEALARLRERALAQARPPQASENVLFAPPAKTSRRPALLFVALGVGQGLWLPVPMPLRVAAGVLAAALAVAGLIGRRSLPAWALYPSRLFLRREGAPPAEIPLGALTAKVDGDAVSLTHGDATLTLVDGVDEGERALALVQLGAASLLTHASPGEARDRCVLGRARTETGEPGALLVMRQGVVFLPHATAARALAALTGQPAWIRYTADCVLEGLRLLPAVLVELLVDRLPPDLGARAWDKTSVERHSDLRSRGRHANADDEVGFITLSRDGAVLELQVSYLDSLRFGRAWDSSVS